MSDENDNNNKIEIIPPSSAQLSPRQCTAKSKRSGGRCQNMAVLGRTTCRMHGGTQPIGMASPNYKHGKYSKALPHNLREDYERLRNDQGLLELTDQIALHQTRVAQILKDLTEGESGQWLLKLRETKELMLEARAMGDVQLQARYLNDIIKLIDQGSSEAMAWQELSQHSQLLSRLVETEGRRMERAEMSVRVDQALMFVDQVSQAVAKHVSDQSIRAAIAQELLALTSG